MTKRYLTVTGFTLLCIAFSACDPAYLYEYHVTNNSDSVIHVHMYSHTAPNAGRYDTLVTIAQGQTATVMKTEHYTEGLHGPYFREVNRDIDSCVVTRGQVLSARNYKNDSAWSFGKSGKTGIYNTSVTTSEF
jgi:hypothetical protein